MPSDSIYNMKKRMLSATLTVLCFSISLLAQSTLRLPPIKIDRLKGGDTFMVRVTGPAPLNAGTFNYVNNQIIIRDDGKLNLPLVGDVQAAGLLWPELLKVVEARYTNYFSQLIWPCCEIPIPRVIVQFVR
jgi:protein involved in polysaccharide export with SLBB domain